jgi:hypothetical protein
MTHRVLSALWCAYASAAACDADARDLGVYQLHAESMVEHRALLRRARYQEWRRRRLERKGSMHGALLRFALLGVAGAGAAALCGLTPRDALASVRAIPSVLRQARPRSLMRAGVGLSHKAWGPGIWSDDEPIRTGSQSS